MYNERAKKPMRMCESCAIERDSSMLISFFWLVHSAKVCDINHVPLAHACWSLGLTPASAALSLRQMQARCLSQMQGLCLGLVQAISLALMQAWSLGLMQPCL